MCLLYYCAFVFIWPTTTKTGTTNHFTTIVSGVVEASWVDPDTPEKYWTSRSSDKWDQRSYNLVFSDEFERDGRTFHDGNDPRWTAINKNDCE